MQKLQTATRDRRTWPHWKRSAGTVAVLEHRSASYTARSSYTKTAVAEAADLVADESVPAIGAQVVEKENALRKR